MMFFIYLILIILLVIFAVLATICSVIGGVVSSIFVSFVSVIKSCAVGINREISNVFMKVIMYIVLALTVLVVVGPLAYCVVATILSIFGGM